jgi:hypothetical protein
MFQKLQFAICPLGKHWGAERLHDFLDRNRLCSQLIPRRALIIRMMYQHGVFGSQKKL